VPTLIVPRGRVDLSRVGMRAAAVRLVVDSGPRGVIDVDVEGVVVPMLVHANAGFTVMLTHDALRRINGTRVAKETEFGLGADLRVSDLGRGTTTLGSLAVAGSRLSDVRCEVFQLPTTNWEGMLGVGWLAAVEPVVDLANRWLFVPTARQRAEIDERLGADATRVELTRDEMSDRYTSLVSVDSGGATSVTFVASTVADTIVDVEYARRCGIELGPVVGEEHGPTGAVVANHRAKEPVRFYSSGDLIATLTPEVHDVYAYSGAERPTSSDAIGGYLGADLLLATGAILDFGQPRAAGGRVSGR
jgi:hypothetical protein